MATPQPPLSFILNHLGEDRERYFGAVAPPIIQSSNFAFPSVASFRAAFKDELSNHLYSRGNNPTVEILRKKIAALDGAEDALVFGSGIAPISVAALGLLRAGDGVLCIQKPYSWTRHLVRDLLPRFGIDTAFVDLRDPTALSDHWRDNTRLILLESPNSWTYEQQDLSAIAQVARARGALTLIDNTWSSPLYQQPIAHGIDLVATSATKYIGGHSDVVAGTLSGSSTLIRKIFASPFMAIGPLLSPHDAWLLIRSLRTLPLRMAQIAATTHTLIAWLRAHPRVRAVYAVGTPDYPQVDLSAKQLSGHSGMLTIALDTDELAAVERFCDGLQCFLMAVSWGGHESLIFPVAALLDPAHPTRQIAGLGSNWVRLSIGLEDADTLMADLDQALNSMVSN